MNCPSVVVWYGYSFKIDMRSFLGGDASLLIMMHHLVHLSSEATKKTSSCLFCLFLHYHIYSALKNIVS